MGMAAHSSLRAGYSSALRINASEVFEMLTPSDKRGCWWIHVWDRDPYTGEKLRSWAFWLPRYIAKSSGSLVNNVHWGDQILPNAM